MTLRELDAYRQGLKALSNIELQKEYDRRLRAEEEIHAAIIEVEAARRRLHLRKEDE